MAPHTSSTFDTTTGKKYGFSASGRISPYFEGVERAGGKGYRNHGPTYVPWVYPESDQEQYRAVTNGVVLWDTATEQQLQVKGRDARQFVDRLVTRDLRRLKPGRCTYTFVCDEHGAVICDPVLMMVDEQTIWLSQSKTDLLYWAKAHALHFGDRVEITVPDVAPIQLQGPKSRGVLRKLSPSAADGLKFFDCIRSSIAGTDVVISRTGWTGELGYEIYPVGMKPYPWGKEAGMRLWDAFLGAGREFGILVTQFLWARAMESGITIFDGTDKEFNPLEFWRDTVVDLDGNDFIGKKALLKLVSDGGPHRKMVGLIGELSSDVIQSGEWDLPVLVNDDVVGTTRRHAYSPALQKPISLAIVDSRWTKNGTNLTVVHPGGRTSMVVTDLPFIDPMGTRVRS